MDRGSLCIQEKKSEKKSLIAEILRKKKSSSCSGCKLYIICIISVNQIDYKVNDQLIIMYIRGRHPISVSRVLVVFYTKRLSYTRL